MQSNTPSLHPTYTRFMKTGVNLWERTDKRDVVKAVNERIWEVVQNYEWAGEDFPTMKSLDK